MAAHAGALVLYAALTIALTWPLTTNMGGLVPHDLGDPLLTTWTLWWNSHALPFSDEWWDGPTFFPASATLTLTDHRVGLGLITTPLIWSGISPLAAQNVAFLASFFLSAASAYALCFTLTRSAVASLVGGLVFGFNPFRAEHLPHLELLSSYWLPIVLLALHRWAVTLRVGWLVLLATGLMMQALTCSYYFFFSGVLLALWLVWFAPRSASIPQYATLALALITPLALLAPVLLAYREAHVAMGLSRSILEIEAFSADLLGLFTPPDLLAFWNAPRDWLRPEGALMPGLTAVLITAMGVVTGRASIQHVRDARMVSMSRTLALLAAVVMTAFALIPALYGPISVNVGGLHISSSNAYKPLSVAAALFGVWFLSSQRVRDAWRRQSPLAFYALATIAMWLFALGPTARLMGQRVLYKAPYSWLMWLPGFRDEFRVPARFAMLATLTLSVAAALALWKILARQPARVRFAAMMLVATAIVVESWIEPLPLVAAPAPLEIPAAVPGDAVIAELPFGAFEDGVAMYHAIAHRRPIVNGLSGYDPPHHAVLRAAFGDGGYDALPAIARRRSVAIFIRRTADGAQLSQQLTATTPARRVTTTDTHDVLLLPRVEWSESRLTRDAALAIRAITSAINAAELPRMIDGDRRTGWQTPAQQTGSESFTVDLGGVFDVTELVLSVGGYTTMFPRAVAIDVSLDGSGWREVLRQPTSAKSVEAAIESPLEVPLVFGISVSAVRYLRVTQVAQSNAPWAVTELSIRGRAPARPQLSPPPHSR